MEKNLENIVHGFISNIGEKSIESVLRCDEFQSVVDESFSPDRAVLLDFSNLFKKPRPAKKVPTQKENCQDSSNVTTLDTDDQGNSAGRKNDEMNYEREAQF